MRSSTGQHYPALDHVRAIAAFLVFAWHFLHATNGYPVPYGTAPVGPFALLDEGHVGVAVFMTLSGYLLAKLLSGRQVEYAPFLWSRFIRLAPLLAFVIILVGIQRLVLGMDMATYFKEVAWGPLLWTWPNGGWSITVEAHFYVLLPMLLFLVRRHPSYLFVLIATAILVRLTLWGFGKTVYWYAYATILMHFFMVFILADMIHRHVMDISNFYVALLWAIPAFLLVLPVCWLTHRFIELPPLRYRRKYIDLRRSDSAHKSPE